MEVATTACAAAAGNAIPSGSNNSANKTQNLRTERTAPHIAGIYAW
jgi:hypothetical protein